LKTGLKFETTVLEINSSQFGAWPGYFGPETDHCDNGSSYHFAQVGGYLHYGNCIGAST